MKTLRELRTTYGLTQKELATLFGVSVGSIQRAEKSTEDMTYDLLRKYAISFRIRPEDIYLGNAQDTLKLEEDKKAAILSSMESRLLTDKYRQQNEEAEISAVDRITNYLDSKYRIV